MKTILTLITGILVGVFGSLYLAPQGQGSGEKLASTQSTSSLTKSPAIPPANANAKYQNATTFADKLSQMAPPTTNEQIQALFEEAFREQNNIKRTTNVLALLQKMTPENGQLFFQQWLLFSRQHPLFGDKSEVALINRRFGQIIGPSVLGKRTGNSEKDLSGVATFVKDQFQGWMESDAVAAKAWMDNLKNERFREALVPAYLESLTMSNPQDAIKHLSAMPPELQGQYATDMVAKMHKSFRPEEIENWLLAEHNNNTTTTSHGPPAWLLSGMQSLFDGLLHGRQPGPEAAEMVERNLNKSWADPEWVTETAAKYAQSYPEAALDWALKMVSKSEDEDPAILTEAILNLPKEFHSAAQAKIEQFPADLKDLALQALKQAQVLGQLDKQKDRLR